MTSRSSTLVDIRGLEKKFDLSGGLLEQISFKGGRFHRKQEAVHAINGVDLQVQKGEALCVVGESGCGKSTLAKLLLGLEKPTSGQVLVDGESMETLDRRGLAGRQDNGLDPQPGGLSVAQGHRHDAADAGTGFHGHPPPRCRLLRP